MSPGRPPCSEFGTGSIGLPAGWTIAQAHAGDVRAKGPKGELARFGMAVPVSNPNDPQSRAIGGFVKIPYGSDARTRFDAIVRFNNRGHAIPTHQISTVKDSKGSGGGHSYFLIGDVDYHDGKGLMREWVQLGVPPPLMMGSYQVTISQVAVPEALANAEAKTAAAMLGSYRPNAGAIIGQVKADTIIDRQVTANYTHWVAGVTDSTDRMTQGMSDYLGGQTVVRDTLLNGHARVDDDLAGALVDADPNRFEKVPLSGYISGIDY